MTRHVNYLYALLEMQNSIAYSRKKLKAKQTIKEMKKLTK